ncbi:hypothetical protein [Thiocystis minor]|nr:hypothetical protein [Thiocystis minor]
MSEFDAQRAQEIKDRREIQRIKNRVQDFCVTNWPEYFGEVAA